MKYLLGLLASVALIVLVLVLVFRSFSAGPTLVTSEPLTDYAATNALVTLTVDGPVVSEQKHVAYRISVGRSEVRIEALKGYTYEITDTRTFTNNQESFYTFLRALDLAGFTKGEKSESEQAGDDRGVCATGRRYIFGLTSGTSEVQRYWSTSCRKFGTFKGNATSVRQLFNHQVPDPDFSQVTGSLGL
jgi:hypothetical protein